MNSVARVFVVINLLLAFGFLATAGVFLKQNDEWKKKYTQSQEEKDALEAAKNEEINRLQQEIADLQADLRKRNDQISSLQTDKSDLETRLQAALEQRATAEQDKEKLIGQYQNAVSQLADMKSRLDGLDQLIDRYKDQVLTAQRERDAAIQERTAAVEELQAAKDAIHEGEKEVARLKDEWSRTQAVLARYTAEYPPPARKSQPRVDGRVVMYDPSANVIQINRGRNHNVAVGHEFDIVRGSAFICTVKIDQVSDNTCIGHVTEVRWPGRSPQAGDLATTL